MPLRIGFKILVFKKKKNVLREIANFPDEDNYCCLIFDPIIITPYPSNNRIVVPGRYTRSNFQAYRNQTYTAYMNVYRNKRSCMYSNRKLIIWINSRGTSNGPNKINIDEINIVYNFTGSPLLEKSRVEMSELRPVSFKSVDDFTAHYDLKSQIGEGTFSNVWLCVCRDDGQEYAAKILKKTYGSIMTVDDWHSIAEVNVAKSIMMAHPFLLMMEKCYHEQLGPGRVIMVSELMKRSLCDVIEAGECPLPDNRVVTYMYQLLEGNDDDTDKYLSLGTE